MVLTYNHQNYILEHLESIKFLVETYGAGIEVDLIVNDDCSRDQTCDFVNRWLQINKNLFRNVTTLFNTKNIGTCASLNNMLEHVVAEHIKITAGDDVYSYENIFELIQHKPDVAFLSGRALYLLGNQLGVNKFWDTLATVTQVIYENCSLLHRFKHFSYNNGPNIYYAAECLMHCNVRTYLQKFDVTEDWPIQIAIAREFPRRRFHLIDEVLVYYRRTLGSAYIIASQRFVKDKILIYDDLIEQEKSLVEKIRLKNRKYLFIKNSRIINKLLNIDAYLFLLSWLARFLKIHSRVKGAKIDLDRHKNHYRYISNQAKSILEYFQRNELMATEIKIVSP